MRARLSAPTRQQWRHLATAVLGLRHHRSDDLVGMVRTVFFRFGLVTLLFAVVMLAGSGASDGARAGGAVGLMALTACWFVGHRRGRFEPWQLAVEGPALAALAVGTGDPLTTLGVMYVGLNFRATYGSVRAAAGVWIVYLAAHLLAIGVAESLGTAGPAATLDSPVVFVQIPGFALTVTVMRILVAVSADRDREQRGQEELARTGWRLTAARRIRDVAAATRDGATAIASEHGGSAAAVALPDRDGLVIASATDASLVGQHLPAAPAVGSAIPELHSMPGPRTFDAAAARALGLPWAGLTAVPLRDGDTHLGVVLVACTGRDVEVLLTSLASQTILALARVRASGQIEAREARFSSLVATAGEVIRVVDAAATIAYESPAVRHVLGYDPDELVGESGFALVHPDDLDPARRAFEEVLAQPERYRTVELRARHAAGDWRPMEVWMRNLLHDPAVGGVVVSYRDISERKDLEARLRHQALHDGLTGLPNRSLFFDRLSQGLERRRRTGDQLAVLFIDLDDFKTMNDELGHATGDEALQTVAQRLRSTTRTADTCARLGGDEFAVLLETMADEADVHDIAQRVQAALNEPLSVGGMRVPMAVSIGAALTVAAETPDELVHNADAAMYRAKNAGPGRLEWSEPDTAMA